MSIGARLREERDRLRLSQTDFAALAGASKGAQAKWEKDEASPNAVALVAFADAGADVLYILSGRRTADRPDNVLSDIEDQIAAIRRDMLKPTRSLSPGEDAAEVEELSIIINTNRLSSILGADAHLLTPEVREELESLLAINTSPVQLAAFRAADHIQRRARHREMKAQLASWLEGEPYQPSGAVTNLLATLALEYAVPVKLLVELVEELHDDIGARRSD